MADIKLGDGKEITFDLTSLTLKEYRALFDPKQPKEDEDRIVSRAAGLSLEEYVNLTYLDWKRLFVAFLKKAREPIVDPS